MEEQRFHDRMEAGQLLAARLTVYAHRPDVLVLALPRGGVPVAFAVARALHVPLDVIIVRKLGVPREEELAMGAIASGGVCMLNRLYSGCGILRKTPTWERVNEWIEIRRSEPERAEVSGFDECDSGRV